ncbi:MAG: WbqC family protein, partial [Candidatus Eremiobacterota bacterium]
LDICKKEAAKVYINPIGGSNLYKRNVFEKEGIELRFLKSRYISYKQNTSEFIPWLSIIDIMMFNSKETICKYLEEYELLSGGRNGESL